VPEKNVPYYARWVSKFLAFSNKSSQSNYNTLTVEFVDSLKSDTTIAEWQVRQAEEAIRLYLHHFGGADKVKVGRGEVRSDEVVETTGFRTSS